jgi:hypothetical protein
MRIIEWRLDSFVFEKGYIYDSLAAGLCPLSGVPKIYFKNHVTETGPVSLLV